MPEAWQPVVEEAHRFYQRAFRTDPMVNLQVMGVAFDIQEPQVSGYSTNAWLYYQRYYAWFVDLGMGRYRSAADRLDKLAQREFNEAKHPEDVPDYILWYRGLADAHSMQIGRSDQRFPRAARPSAARQAIKLNAHYSPSYYLLGRVTEELGLPEEARDHYKAFLARSPLRSQELRADATERLGKLPK